MYLKYIQHISTKYLQHVYNISTIHREDGMDPMERLCAWQPTLRIKPDQTWLGNPQ